MRIAALIVIAVGGAVVFAGPKPSGSSAAHRITIKAAGNNIFYADAVFNDAVRVKSVIDTGASSVAIACDHVQRQLALPLGEPVNVRTANGHKTAHHVTIPSLRIGAIEVRDVPGMVSKQTGDCLILVGNTFLQRLQSVTLKGDRLHLAGRSGASRRKGS